MTPMKSQFPWIPLVKSAFYSYPFYFHVILSPKVLSTLDCCAEPLENSFVFVSGATSGIGLELAKSFGRNGFNVIVHGRNQEKIQKTIELLEKEKPKESESRQKFLGFEMDFREDAGKCGEKFEKFLKKDKIDIDIMINNAGTAKMSRYSTESLQDIQNMMNTNYLVPTALTQKWIQQRLTQTHEITLETPKKSILLNISSMAAINPNPYSTGYAASKAALFTSTRALASELAHLEGEHSSHFWDILKKKQEKLEKEDKKETSFGFHVDKAKLNLKVLNITPDYVSTPMIRNKPTSFRVISPEELASMLYLLSVKRLPMKFNSYIEVTGNWKHELLKTISIRTPPNLQFKEMREELEEAIQFTEKIEARRRGKH